MSADTPAAFGSSNDAGHTPPQNETVLVRSTLTVGFAAPRSGGLRPFPIELIVVAAFVAAIFGVVAIGGAVASAIEPQSPPWYVTAAIYAVPALLAFAAYWALARWFQRTRDAGAHGSLHVVKLTTTEVRASER